MILLTSIFPVQICHWSIKGLFQNPVLTAKLVMFTGLEEFIEVAISEVKYFHHPLNLLILFFNRVYLGILSFLLVLF